MRKSFLVPALASLLAASTGSAQEQQNSCPRGYSTFKASDYGNPEEVAKLPQLFRKLPLNLGVQEQQFLGVSAAIQITQDRNRLFFTARGQRAGFAQGMEREIARICYTKTGDFIMQAVKATHEQKHVEVSGRATPTTITVNDIISRPITLSPLSQAQYNTLAGRIPAQIDRPLVVNRGLASVTAGGR